MAVSYEIYLQSRKNEPDGPTLKEHVDWRFSTHTSEVRTGLEVAGMLRYGVLALVHFSLSVPSLRSGFKVGTGID